MSKNELVARIEALNAWENLIEEAKAEAEALRDSIKQEMMEREVEELTAGQYHHFGGFPPCQKHQTALRDHRGDSRQASAPGDRGEYHRGLHKWRNRSHD